MQSEKRSVHRAASQKRFPALILRRVLAYAVLVFLSVLCLFWFYALAINCTRDKFAIQLGFSWLPGKSFAANLNKVLHLENMSILRGMLNSFLVAASGSLLSVYFSALTAYAVFVYHFRARKAAYCFILLIMMIPTQISALGFYDMVYHMGLLNNYIPLIVPTIAAPMTFFFIIQYMEGGLPLEIVEAARIDGSGEFATFNRIVLPVIKPALAVEIIFAYVANWNNFFMPSLILSKETMRTLPVMISVMRNASWVMLDMSKVYMCIGLAILPVIIVYLFLSKYIVQGVALGSVKG